MGFWKQLVYMSIMLNISTSCQSNMKIIGLPWPSFLSESFLHPDRSHLASALPIPVSPQTVKIRGSITYLLFIRIIADNLDICDSILCFGSTSDHKFVILICNKRERIFRMAWNTECDSVVIIGEDGWFKDARNFDKWLSFECVEWQVATKMEKGSTGLLF